jgi:tetratricopeptide (TPR) repeat protein
MHRLALVALLLPGVVCAEAVVALPFFNHTKSANLDWVGESIAESVQDSLASEGVLVLGRDERLEAYRRLSLRPGAELTRASELKIGESLDASHVVYGEYELLPAAGEGTQSKGSLRITAHVLDLKKMRQSKAIQVAGAMEDLAALQAHLGWQALGMLGRKNVPAEQTFMRARTVVRLDALENYVRGLMAASAEQRHRFFTAAARLDANYSPPCFQLGKMNWEKKEYQTAAGWFARVTQSDPHFLEAQFFLGLCRYQAGDFPAAEQAFQRVAGKMPLNEVFNNLGAAQDRQSHSPDAIASYRKALEGDNGDPDYHFNLGYALWRAGQFTEAATSLRAALARNPGDTEATTLLGRALKQDGPRPGDPKTEARQRTKSNYDETAYRQLQAELGK